MAIIRPSAVSGLQILAQAFRGLTSSGEDVATWVDQEANANVIVMGPGGTGEPIHGEDDDDLITESGEALMTET